MRRILLLGLVFSLSSGCSDPGPTGSRDPVRYEISFDDRAHHEAEIRVTWTGLGEAPLEVRMSRSSPGRYALHEFAKNVYDVRATGADGAPLEVERPDPYQWNVLGHGGTVTVTYTLYADHADGTYSAIDRTHGHLNMPATFLWARGHGDRPVTLRVDVPEGSGWRVATQLAPTSDPFEFTAPNLYYFLDSPTEVSDFWLKEWDVDGQTVRVALHHDGSEADAERYAAAAAAIVDASRDIYGELPVFDFGTYTFLACYLPWADGDGMEHRNSTVLTSSASLESNMTGLLGTVAHEFFHAWNVERIRPTSLEPFDFEEANMSRELWFAEGFTSYFDDLILWRAGLISSDAFAARMGGIANSVVNARGRRYFTPIEMSMQAPFVDAATAVDPNNRSNTFFSYYTWGSGIGLALDLMLRTRSDALTLDHVMRDMWQMHGRTESPYEVDDLEASLARVTGDSAFASDFFARFVRGSESPEYAALLPLFGVEMERARPSAVSLGPLQLRFEEDAAIVLGTPLEGTPLHEAGVDRGDRILHIAGTPITDRGAIDAVLGTRTPGDSVEIRFESRGSAFVTRVGLSADETLAGRWIPDGSASAAQRALRDRWRAATPGN